MYRYIYQYITNCIGVGKSISIISLSIPSSVSVSEMRVLVEEGTENLNVACCDTRDAGKAVLINQKPQ